MSWRYRPEIDGLRSLAVYLVVLFHCRVDAFSGGFVGVDLFFVLSGFLVTHVILAEVDRSGSFGLGWFYSRRVRRLLPAAVVAIVVTAALQVLVASEPQRLGMLRDGQAALVYLANWHFISDAHDYFAAEQVAQSPFLHYWSLSIEEQFYLLLPAALLLLLRRPRLLAPVVAAITAASIALQVWQADRDATYAYYATETRIYQLTAGVLLALLTRRLVARRGGGVAGVLGVVGVLVVGSSLVDLAPSWRGLLVTLASVGAVWGLYAAPRGPAARVLALRVPRYLGQISYGTYLWHWPVILVIGEVMEVGPWVTVALAGTVATGLAALSHEVLETPIRRSVLLDRHRWATVATGLTASVLAAVLVLPVLLRSDVPPAVGTGREDLSELSARAAWLSEPVPTGLDLEAALADVPEAGPLCTPSDLTACERVSGSGPRVLLLGDSQAATFVTAFESLAREHDLTLLTNVLRGCPWQAGLDLQTRAEEAAACESGRDDFYRDVLPLLDVDVVVLVSLSRADAYWEERLAASDGPDESLAERHLRTATSSVEAIAAAGARAVIVKALLGTQGYERNGPDPLDCLARADRLGECAVVPGLEKPFTDGIADALAAASPDSVAAVDLNPVLCPDAPLCRPVIDGTVVWKDSDHVTGTFLDEQRSALWARLISTGLLD